MAEESEITPLSTKDYSDEIVAQRELNVQQYISTNENYVADTGRVATFGGDVDIEKAGNLADGGDRQEFVEDVKEIELREDSQEDPQLPVRLRILPSDPPRCAGDLSRLAVGNARIAVSACRGITYAIRSAIDVGKKRVDEAIRRAEEASELEEASRYRALANKYDYATRLAVKRSRKMEAAAESAEKAAMEAEIAANQVAVVSEETSTETEMLWAAFFAANAANMATIAAHRMEYLTVKSMKKCLQELDLGNVTTGYLSRRQSEEPRCRGNRQTQAFTCSFSTASFIFGILIFTTLLPCVKDADIWNTHISLIIVGSALVGIPVFHLLYKIFICYRNRRREASRRKIRNIITRVDNRLNELTNFFDICKISPVHSESDDEEQ